MLRKLIERPRLADVLFRLDPWGNPMDPKAIEDPMYNADVARRDVPMVWKPLYQQWFVLGFDEAREVLASPHTGTANQATTLLDVSPYNKFSERSKAFFANLMLLTDPPLHSRLRGLVNRAFTPRQVANLDERMGKIINDLIAEFGDEVEIMADFAMPFPAYVIAELLGLDTDHFDELREISTVLVQLTNPWIWFEPAEFDRAVDQLYGLILAAAAERRRNPQDDVLTGLATAVDDDGDRLTDDELVATAGIILIAGHETTALVLGNSIVNFYRYPKERAKVEADPALWPNAVNELLRFDTALRVDPRTALEDFEVAGNRIKKGQNIAVLNHMVNRDLRRWPDADELRVDREDPVGLSFGHGIHYCLGANLAQAELQAALPRLLDALGDYTIPDGGLEWRRSLVLRGPERLRVRRGRS